MRGTQNNKPNCSIISIVCILLMLSMTQCVQDNKRKTSIAGDRKALISKLIVNNPVQLSDSIPITFVTMNPTSDTLAFTEYHTPFEGILNKFLSIQDSAGLEVEYIGVMARRVMPPPEETYHIVLPGEEKRITFNLLKGYKIDRPGTYTIRYEGENISGIANGPTVSLVVQ